MHAVVAVVTHEGRLVLVRDIGGAFLNADITNTSIKVHMRLNRTLKSMLVSIDPVHTLFVEEKDTYVVELDNTLYGYVEVATL